MHMTTSRESDVRTPLMLAITIASGTLAYADPVRFDNDGAFQWTDGVFLDMTRGASKQTGTDQGVATFFYDRRTTPCCYYVENVWVFGSTPDAQIEGYPISSVRAPGAIVPNDFFNVPYGQQFRTSQLLGYYYSTGAGFYTQFDGRKPFGVPGDVGYIAARFELDGATHYGWVGLTLTHYFGAVRWVFDLVAWGYEREPNTPIEAGAVPAPSAALALLAFGAAAGATRVRRG